MANYFDLPEFDSLPPVKGMPQGCAWGLFDQDGKVDRLGCLNLLTPKIVQEAYKEARDGVSISLNWPIGACQNPFFGRQGLTHTVISYYDTAGLHAFDDIVEFNTQCSSQWDSLVHFGHQATGANYNGVIPKTEDLVQPLGSTDVGKEIPTLNHWHDRGGLVGRGVLLDYRAYAQARGITYDLYDASVITIKDLEAIAEYQGTNFKHGDILIVRSGYTEDLTGKSAEEQNKKLGTGRAIGVEGTIEAAKWFWNHHFSAVAGDAVAFESMPPRRPDGSFGTNSELVLHQYFLSYFGLNIGELWDLKALGEHCKKIGRYTFLLTSVPLNVSGLVGSPPNALALF
ncbi:uncharacterized protein A1O5_04036 [Cladophialophora psammophila CBS 110553]|uniref:Cyclase n=1 Tax=Cladophialophora psammophila CBS 110553 TaxID=1182543 RepID=W9WY86_9EURO|nr:uncharacterized protein A1O5_04036 [Cladophialophora psammophila CBS 110553]EXJ72888.1 hypothetical protein A1O5_04036 [Cladophialophora psammophila CBS 110553]